MTRLAVFKYAHAPGRPHTGILLELSDRTNVDLSDIVVIRLDRKLNGYSIKVGNITCCCGLPLSELLVLMLDQLVSPGGSCPEDLSESPEGLCTMDQLVSLGAFLTEDLSDPLESLDGFCIVDQLVSLGGFSTCNVVP